MSMSRMTGERQRRVMPLLGVLVLAACTAPPQKSVAEQQAEEQTAARVYSVLNADPVYFFRHVDVRVDDGVVYLSGYIWSIPAIAQAKKLAASVPGVHRVVNQMELEREGQRGGGHVGAG